MLHLYAKLFRSHGAALLPLPADAQAELNKNKDVASNEVSPT